MNSFLQSNDWLDFQKSLGRKVLRYHTSGIEAGIIVHKLPLGKSYFYIPHGPIMSFDMMSGGIKNNVNSFINWLKTEAKREKAIFVKAEPLEDKIAEVLIPGGFKKSKREIQPHKTVILDLTQSEDDLLSRLHHKTRYNIRVAERENVVIEKGGDFEDFWRLMKKTTERDDFTSHDKEYYRRLLTFFGNGKEIETEIWFARLNRKPIAATITLTHGDTIYYLHSASNHEMRNLKAPNLLRWTILLAAKRRGLKRADFWGIDAKRWPGITAFKLGWGGRVVEHPAAFDLTINYFLFVIYRLGKYLVGR